MSHMMSEFIKLVFYLLIMALIGIWGIRIYYVWPIVDAMERYWSRTCGLAMYFARRSRYSDDYWKDQYLQLGKDKEFLESAKAEIAERERTFTKMFMTKKERHDYERFCREYERIDSRYATAKQNYEQSLNRRDM